LAVTAQFPPLSKVISQLGSELWLSCHPRSCYWNNVTIADDDDDDVVGANEDDE
jgi:hypothetical protein